MSGGAIAGSLMAGDGSLPEPLDSGSGLEVSGSRTCR